MAHATDVLNFFNNEEETMNVREHPRLPYADIFWIISAFAMRDARIMRSKWDVAPVGDGLGDQAIEGADDEEHQRDGHRDGADERRLYEAFLGASERWTRGEEQREVDHEERQQCDALCRGGLDGAWAGVASGGLLVCEI